MEVSQNVNLAGLFKKSAESVQKSNKTQDPVCGMTVNLDTTQFKSTHQGKVYGFCSVGCKATFDANPNEYANS